MIKEYKGRGVGTGRDVNWLPLVKVFLGTELIQNTGSFLNAELLSLVLLLDPNHLKHSGGGVWGVGAVDKGRHPRGSNNIMQRTLPRGHP